VREFIYEKAAICQPDEIYVCDGSEEENQELLHLLQKSGMVQELQGMKNW
jgi:phosphoenolpyruvate carboxykinase (GTP)